MLAPIEYHQAEASGPRQSRSGYLRPGIFVIRPRFIAFHKTRKGVRPAPDTTSI